MNPTVLSPRSALLAFLAGLAVFLALARPLCAGTPSPISISPQTLPSLQVGTPFAVTFTATGGTAPYTWTLPFGALPAGLFLDAQTGTITGTPTLAGAKVIFVRVTDAAGITAQRGWNVSIAAAPYVPGAPTSYTVSVTNGTVNGAASTSFAPGATVTLAAAAPPAGQWFQQWNSNVPVANSFAPTTTLTMPAADVSATASYFTPAPVPQPVTDHPRLWINSGDLATLRARADLVGNPVYANLRTLLSTCIVNYQTQFFPNGQPNPVNPDLGDVQGYSGLLSEDHALVFAFFALIDPDPSARVLHAQRARDILMLAMNEAVKGHAAGQPFRDPMFAVYNRANAHAANWPLAVDWLQGVTDANGQPVAILSVADKKTIRDVFLIWANDCLNAYTCGGDHPSPIGVTNSTALLPGGNAHRVAANNYYAGHARLLTLMALALDPADDPAVDPATPAPILGNTLRSYITNATGAWLYQQFAMFGDPAAVRAAYHLPANASVGLASGGISPEGSLYGHAYAYTLGQLLALKTAGFADPALSGPQTALVTAPVWDRYLPGFAHTILPAPQVVPSHNYLGPIYRVASFGDTIRPWITPDFMQTFALKHLLDRKNGVADNLDALRWFAVNAVEGGAGALAQHVAQSWTWGVENSILYYLLLDPHQAPAADPRPAYATHFIDAGNGRLLARTDWSPASSIFTFRSSWETINHQNGDAGQFELYRKGEWLLKELSNYDNNGNGQSSLWHNSLALQNWCANGQPRLNSFEAAYWPNGSQWNNGVNAGDPVTAMSAGPGYAYAQTDMTKLYNRPDIWTAANSATDIQHASRAILWLSPDVIVVYDRASSLHNGFKRFNLTLTAAPSIDQTNHAATVTTPGHQRLFVQTLLPANATTSFVPIDHDPASPAGVTAIAELEPGIGRLVVEDASNPTDIRFLHVIQAADLTGDRLPTAAVATTAGNAFSGAIVGTDVVLFPVNYGETFAGTSYRVPLTARKHHVGGLTPGATYSVIAASTGTQADLVIQPSATGAFTADSAGLLVFDLAAALQ